MTEPTDKMDIENSDWSNKTILLVEDLDAHHLFIISALKKTGVNVVTTKSGRDAIDVVRENLDVDLVLMDIRLPDLDGYEATRQIKLMRPDLPVVALTPYVMVNDKGRALQTGCDDLIVKPLQLRAVTIVCARYLG